MIQKSLFRITTIGFVVIALTACGGKGIDRKLNYSDGTMGFMKSYNDALDESTPEQQKILRKRSMFDNLVILTTTAFELSTKIAEENKRRRKMTLRELFVQRWSERQNELNNIIQYVESFQNEKVLKVESISIDDVTPKNITEDTRNIKVDGTLLMRNDSDSFDYDFRGCQLALVFDGVQIEEWHGSGDCQTQLTIKGKGGKEAIKFDHYISGKENIKMFYDLLKGGDGGKIGWKFKHSEMSRIRPNSDTGFSISIEIDASALKKYKAELQEITADLEAMKK